MKNLRYKVQLVDLISWLFIALFIYAASSKLIQFDKFKVQIGKSPLLTAFSAQVAWFIPAVEITIALMLLSKTMQLLGLCLAFTLMTIFSAYIFCILRFSYYVPCSCGGILQNMSWLQHLYFNLLFVFLGVT